MPRRDWSKNLSPPNAIRARAEQIVRLKRAEFDTTEDMRRFLQEIEVHQIELELQNEELRSIQADLEAACERHADLYEYAPIGYVTLDADANIIECNLMA